MYYTFSNNEFFNNQLCLKVFEDKEKTTQGKQINVCTNGTLLKSTHEGVVVIMYIAT